MRDGTESLKHMEICDRCKSEIPVGGQRYIMHLEVVASKGELEISESDLDRDFQKEMEQLLKQMQEMKIQKMEEDIYKCLRFTLCQGCKESILKNPLYT